MAEKKSAKTPRTYYIGTGRRKTSVARVRIAEGKGNILINDREVDQYFSEDKDRAAVLGPLKVTDQINRVDVFVKATGGGITGQAGAVSQGIARALKTMFSPESEQKRYMFHGTTIVKSYQDEKKLREKAKAIPVRPAAPVTAGAKPATPPIPGATSPPASQPEPADPATGMIKKLRDSGFLTRDARMKERKKYGLRGARRGTQFSKR
jgi:small subunit ribosomal protein S9